MSRSALRGSMRCHGGLNCTAIRRHTKQRENILPQSPHDREHSIDPLELGQAGSAPASKSSPTPRRAAQQIAEESVPIPRASPDAIDLAAPIPARSLPPRQPLPTPVRYPDKSSIKLGLDVHLGFIMAVVQRDHAAPRALPLHSVTLHAASGYETKNL